VIGRGASYDSSLNIGGEVLAIFLPFCKNDDKTGLKLFRNQSRTRTIPIQLRAFYSIFIGK